MRRPGSTDPTLHRNGHKYKDDGHALTSLPDEDPAHKVQPVVVDKKRLQFLKHNNPVQFRELAEKTLIEIVRFMVAKNGGKPVDFFAVQQEGSYKIGVSLETVKRYVFTHSAGSAELRLTGKKVGVNPDFVPEEAPDEETG
jgi:hypothetical protein